jgi:chromate transport protein ChrA
MIIVLITFLGWMLGGHTGAKLAFGGTIAASVLVVIFQIVFDLDEF